MSAINHISFSHVRDFGQMVLDKACAFGHEVKAFFNDHVTPRATEVWNQASPHLQKAWSRFGATPYAKNASIGLVGLGLVCPEKNNTTTKVTGLAMTAFSAYSLYKEYTGS